jgi:hypothetical protein
MGVKSKLYHKAMRTPTVARLRHDLCFQRGDGLHRRRLGLLKPEGDHTGRSTLRFFCAPVNGCAASPSGRSRIPKIGPVGML